MRKRGDEGRWGREESRKGWREGIGKRGGEERSCGRDGKGINRRGGIGVK